MQTYHNKPNLRFKDTLEAAVNIEELTRERVLWPDLMTWSSKAGLIHDNIISR